MAECVRCADTLDTPTETQTQTCPVTGFQKASICVPVNVSPFAHAGPTVTKCCGDPVIVPGDKPCPGKKNGVCSFTISQTICVEVPIKFGADAVTGDTFVDCMGASTDNICNNCKEGS